MNQNSGPDSSSQNPHPFIPEAAKAYCEAVIEGVIMSEKNKKQQEVTEFGVPGAPLKSGSIEHKGFLNGELPKKIKA